MMPKYTTELICMCAEVCLYVSPGNSILLMVRRRLGKQGRYNSMVAATVV